jgi:tRNA A37 threonylcarbamoyltransferase TsaD
MKCSLSGLTKNAARCIDDLVQELRNHLTEEEMNDICQEHQPGYYSACLLELSHHARETKGGKHTVDEFADCYDLKK